MREKNCALAININNEGVHYLPYDNSGGVIIRFLLQELHPECIYTVTVYIRDDRDNIHIKDVKNTPYRIKRKLASLLKTYGQSHAKNQMIAYLHSAAITSYMS